MATKWPLRLVHIREVPNQTDFGHTVSVYAEQFQSGESRDDVLAKMKKKSTSEKTAWLLSSRVVPALQDSDTLNLPSFPMILLRQLLLLLATRSYCS